MVSVTTQSRPIHIGILVTVIATSMVMIKGIVAKRVSSPKSTSEPQMISTQPTNGPVSELGIGDTHFHESARAEQIGIDEFLNAFRYEHASQG